MERIGAENVRDPEGTGMTSYRVETSSDEPGVYKYLDGELRDWSGERFLTRSLEDRPDGIASDIFAELKKLDKFVRSLPR